MTFGAAGGDEWQVTTAVFAAMLGPAVACQSHLESSEATATMSESPYSQRREYIASTQEEWMTRFGVEDYVSNEKLTAKLIEDSHMFELECIDLRRKNQELQNMIATATEERKLLQARFENVSSDSKHSYFVSVLASLLLALGVNLVTNESSTSSSTFTAMGWIGLIVTLASLFLYWIAWKLTSRYRPAGVDIEATRPIEAGSNEPQSSD